MTCYVCQQNNFHKLPGLHSQSMMQVCKSCGNLCHEITEDRQQKMTDYYRKEYRKIPNSGSLVTTNNKLQYLIKFMGDFLKDKKGLVCGDVGAATGYWLNELKMRGHKVTGSELTLTYRRMCEHFYGIPLTEELEAKHKYDLITIYHVLEHLTEPDKKLVHYKELLSEQGVFLIATPYWLDWIGNQDNTPIPGKNGQEDFDHIFHKDHINLFSKESIKNLFRQVGLLWTKEDYVMYGQAYLLKPGNKSEIHPEDWQTVVDICQRQKQALIFFGNGKYREAIEAYENFPLAHMRLIFQFYGKDPDRQEDMIKALPDNIRQNPYFLTALAQWLKQYERLDDALLILSDTAKVKPGPEQLIMAAEIYALKGQHKEAMQLYSKLAVMHPYNWSKCYDEILWHAAQMPTWDERALSSLKETIFKQAQDSGNVKIGNPPLIEVARSPEQTVNGLQGQIHVAEAKA